MGKKIGRKFVALCSVAVGTIYAAGYVITGAAPIAQAGTSVAQQVAVGHRQAHTGTTGSGTGSKASSTTKSGTAPAIHKYLDGTYQGSGSNRIGTVAVAVTIQQGKIVKAQISACDTHYPEAYINPVLPQQVISTQCSNVSLISGATLSSEDFQNAVDMALSQAQNPKYTGTGNGA